MDIKFDDLDNNFVTTLSGDITSEDTTINMVDVPSNSNEGFLAIDADNAEKLEYVYFNDKGAGYISCPAIGGRGQAGTSAVDHDSGAVVKMYVMREHIKGLLDEIARLRTEDQAKDNGWVPTTEDVTYSDTQEVTVTSALAAKLQKGAKMKMTNDSAVKYFYVVSVSGTTATLSGEVDLVSGAITDVYFSYADCPLGFKRGEDWYSARAVRTSQQVFSDGSQATMTFNSEEYDYNSNLVHTTGIYTVPVTGRYAISGKVFCYDATNAVASSKLILYKNGAGYDISQLYPVFGSGSQAYITLQLLQTLRLSKGDTIKFDFFVDTIDSSAVATGDSSTQKNTIDIQFVGI